MDGKQLKNSILQWAIQGKLVPQNPKDEPASKLLERIAAARNESTLSLPKGAKSKKPAPTSRIYRENGVWCEQIGNVEPKDISDDIPFEIPENWAWCRIGDIFYHASGKQQSSSNKSGGTPQKFITTSNLYWGRFVLDNVKVMNFTEYEIKNCSATKGDLLVCEGGAGYGRSAIWDKDYDICLQNHIHRLRPCVNGICEFVYYFIYLLKETNRLASVGTAMPGLSANRLKELILPLPPLAEQKRIVAKLEKVLPLVDEYNVAQEQLDKLNKELPEALKKSILQQAIQGKLVPQNPKDEPASVLLAKIRKEKESLVKQGKLKKKDLNCDSIAEEDLPFELPSNWEWCRLEDIVWHLSDGTHKTPKYTESGIPFVSVKNMSSGRLSFENTKFVSKEESDILNQRCNPEKGDLLLSKVGTTGIPVIVDVDFQFSLFVSLALIKFFPNLINSSFFVYLIKSPLVQNQVREHTRGVGNKNWVLNDIAKTIIAIPPLAEQKRIVAKLEQLFKVL